jgi:hypothetical protein
MHNSPCRSQWSKIMRRDTTQLFFSASDSATETALAAIAQRWPGLRHSQLGRNIEGSWGAGTFTWDLWWDDGAPTQNIAAQLAQLPGFERADQVTYTTFGGGLREPALQGGIWRTLLLRVRPEAPRQHVAALERDLLRMPAYMAGIRNWSLGRVTAPSAWTHVWQQEYAQLGDLVGEYLLHPYHWGWVDHWFDQEFPDWTVSNELCHAFCPLGASLLSRA